VPVVYLLHPYICEGCFDDVPLTELQYLKAIDDGGRLLCEQCLAKKLTDGVKPNTKGREHSRESTQRRGGSTAGVSRTTPAPPRPKRKRTP
jgi:hypothetical protein